MESHISEDQNPPAQIIFEKMLAKLLEMTEGGIHQQWLFAGHPTMSRKFNARR